MGLGLQLPSYIEKIRWQNQIRSLPCKHFIICIKCIYLQNKYLITPYAVGKDKKSLTMVLPAEVVKTLGINPHSIFLLLNVRGKDDLQFQIIREEDLIKKEKAIPVANVQQESEAFVITGEENRKVHKVLYFNHQNLCFLLLPKQIKSVVYSNKDLLNNKKQDSSSSAVGLGNLQLASESLQREHF
jgi:hypothetical protein